MKSPLLFVSDWSLEVTFERQWAKFATTRTTPVLLALFSLICLIAYRLHSIAPISLHSTAWYVKSELTFADLIDAVRAALWRSHLFTDPLSSLLQLLEAQLPLVC